MNPKFSRGMPRIGQWVFLDGKTIGIMANYDHGAFKTVGDVIVHQPQIKPAISTGDPKKCHVDIVDETGFMTKASLLVDVSRLTPVTRREDIPAPRLKTCAPGWSPRA